MSKSALQPATSRSKIASVLSKLAPKSRNQASKTLAPKTEVNQQSSWAKTELDVTSILGHPMSSTLRIFNAQRSNKAPIREPAGFPINQNFSQRIIYEFADDEANEAIFLTPYMRPSHVFQPLASSPKEEEHVTPKDSTTNERDMPSFLLGRTIRGFSTWRQSSKRVEVKENLPVKEVMPRSHSDVSRVECPSMDLPTKETPTEVKACSPHTPYSYKSTSQNFNLITPGLSHSSKTPSTVAGILTPADSARVALQDDTYFPIPNAHSFIPFPTSPSPVPTSSNMPANNPLLPDQVGSVSRSSSYEVQPSKGYRPLGSEMMETLAFLSRLCARPEVLAGDGESILDGENDDDDSMAPFYHAL